MTSNEQRAALQRKIWDIANNVRGAVDGGVYWVVRCVYFGWGASQFYTGARLRARDSR